MRKKVGLVVASILFIGLLVAAIVICESIDKTWTNILAIIASAILGVILIWPVHTIQDCMDNTTWKESLRKLLRGGEIKKEDRIRISFAYLFRIKVDNRYLLVMNERGLGKYQRVGGVYKCEPKEYEFLTKKFCIEDDRHLASHKKAKNDYRMFVEASKLRRFVKRFQKGSNRENEKDLSREFREEILSTCGFDNQVFQSMSYKMVGRLFDKIAFSKPFQCYELIMADIAEVILTPEQEDYLRETLSNRNGVYLWADITSIEKGRIDSMQQNIADHAVKILQAHDVNLEKIFNNQKYSIDLKKIC